MFPATNSLPSHPGKVLHFYVIQKMLAIGPEKDYQNFDGKVLLAINNENKDRIFYIPSDEEDLPLQKLQTKQIFDLLPADRFHKLIKRWNLNKKEANLIKEFYSQRSEDILDLGDNDNYRLRAAFSEIESLLIHLLKTVYTKKGSDLHPWFSGKVYSDGSTNHLAIQGASGTGKSTWVSNLLKEEQFQDSMLWIISSTNEDPVWKILKQGRRKRLTKFIDPEKIDEPLSIKHFMDPKRPVILLADDILDTLSQRSHNSQSIVRNWLMNLFQEILVKGRVSNVTLFLVYHKPRQGFTSLYEECSALLSFPQSNSHSLMELLTRKLAISKKTVQAVLDRAGSSRFILWKFTQPTCAIYKTGITLI